MDTHGRHFPKDNVLTAARWYLADPLSYRHVEELLTERGTPVDHTTAYCRAIRYGPELLARFKRHHRQWQIATKPFKPRGDAPNLDLA